ncbi:MAG: hypothetical protein Q7T72_13915, partial [Bacteroidales bacterium]|nr:hypothetical protein [Bacteroidales bacterium]
THIKLNYPTPKDLVSLDSFKICTNANKAGVGNKLSAHARHRYRCIIKLKQIIRNLDNCNF